MDYLGFEISSEGVHASPDKVKAVVEWPRPQTVHNVRSFLRLASYYREFIQGFSQIARPLTDLTRAGITWDWNDREEQRFLQLKVTLGNAPVLCLPDFDQQFVVTTDVSDVAVGAVLEQNFGYGLQPIAFASRKLNKAEIRYSACERELLGLAWALGQWRHYFQNSHSVVVRTDHPILRHLPSQATVNARVWKWLAIMRGYDLDIQHIPGKVNLADHLSRQLLKEAAERKGLVTKENQQCVEQLRGPRGATDVEIQDALCEIFQKERHGDR